MDGCGKMILQQASTDTLQRDPLEEIIRAIFLNSLELPKPMESGWAVPLLNEELEQAKSLIDHTFYGSLIEILTLAKQERELLGKEYKPDDVTLAARLNGHDMIGNLKILTAATESYLENEVDNPDLIVNGIFLKTALLQVHSYARHYLVKQGTPDFRLDIPPELLKDLLAAQSSTHKGVCITDPDPLPTHAMAFAVISQFVKNAYSHNPGAEVGIEFERRGRYRIIKVTDNGKGINVAREEIQKIFGTYSSNGGGFGLQFSKRVAELMGGHIELVTTCPQGNTYAYTTGKKVYDRLISGHTKGSVFVLVYPDTSYLSVLGPVGPAKPDMPKILTH